MRPRAWKFRRLTEVATGLLFLIPALVILIAFNIYPIFYTTYLSLTDWNMMSPTKNFIGLENYMELAGSATFRLAFKNTAAFMLSQVVVALAIGLCIALLLNGPKRTLYRLAVFSPTVISVAAVAILWTWLFEPAYGPLNAVRRLVGLPTPHWLGDTKWALPAIMLMNIWKNVGYNAVVFLAGLQNIPRDLYEAAELDGATGWRKFLHITFPLLSPTTFFLTTVTIIWSFQVFDSVNIMTQGGPNRSTSVILFYFYTQTFRFFRVGYGSAAVMVMFLIVACVTFIQNRTSKRWVHY